MNIPALQEGYCWMCSGCLKIISSQPPTHCHDCGGHFRVPSESEFGCDVCGDVERVYTAHHPDDGAMRLCTRHLAERQRDERDEDGGEHRVDG